MVTQRAVARGLARSASISRRARTSAATDSARASRTLARPAPRRRAPRMRLAATTSPVASSRSSASARSASSVDQRARSRDANRVTSGRIGSGVERRVAMRACSRPTPAVRTPDRDRVHSSIASSRSILEAAGGADSSTGRPAAAAGRTRTATSHPVSTATSRPAASPASSSSRVRRDSDVSRPAPGRGLVGAGALAGTGRSPTRQADEAGDDEGAGQGREQGGHDAAPRAVA